MCEPMECLGYTDVLDNKQKAMIKACQRPDWRQVAWQPMLIERLIVAL